LKGEGSNAIKCSSDEFAFGLNSGIYVSDNYDMNTRNGTNIGKSIENNPKVDSKVFFDTASHFAVEESKVLPALD
jgi:hypothetical protein